MIIKLSIRNFGSIKDEQTLSFEATKDKTLSEYYTFEPIPGIRLLKLILIYGANASGKTTVLKALDFVRQLMLQPAQGNDVSLDFQPFLLDEIHCNQPSEIKFAFIQGKIKYSYQITFNQTCILNESLSFSPKEREAKFFTRSTDIQKQISKIEFGHLLKINLETKYKIEANTAWNRSVIAAVADKNIDFPALKTVYHWFKEVLIPLITPNTDLFAWTSRQLEVSDLFRAKLTELLRLADLQIDEIEVVEEKNDNPDDLLKKPKRLQINPKKIIFNHYVNDFSAKFTSKQQSQGTLRYYGIGGILTNLLLESKIASIDELESSLHPDLAKYFLLRFLTQAKTSQMLVTTHNLHLFTEQDILRYDAIWFTEKKEDGATELYSAADFDTAVLRKTSSLLHVYEAGKLGAKPNLGSIF